MSDKIMEFKKPDKSETAKETYEHDIPYQTLYFCLFNGITSISEMIDDLIPGLKKPEPFAASILSVVNDSLKQLQQKSEELFISCE